MADKIRVGIAGARGLVYMPGFLDMPGVEVTALCELNPDILQTKADAFGIPNRYRIYEDMLDASVVDAVFLATPMQLHVPQSLAALAAGKHCLSEVIAATTMDELFWLKEAAEKSDKVYMLCENYCYRPDAVLIRKMVEQGRFGEIYYAESEYVEDIKSWLVYPNGKPSWRQYWQVGKRGAFYPTHCLGPIMKWFAGDSIDEVSCFGVGPFTDPNYRQEDSSTAMIRLKSGKLISVRVDVMSNRPNQIIYYVLQGTRGAVETGRGIPSNKGPDKVYFTDGQVRVSRGIDWEDLWKYSDLLPDEYRNMPAAARKLAANGDYNCCGGDYFVVQDFIRACRGEILSPVNVYEACEWSAVAILSELSAQNNGRAMKMPDFHAPQKDLVYKI
jgi:predicted dehydrogenase